MSVKQVANYRCDSLKAYTVEECRNESWKRLWSGQDGAIGFWFSELASKCVNLDARKARGSPLMAQNLESLN
jgi:hypothetical protein